MSLGVWPALPMLASAPANAQSRPTPATLSGVFRHPGLLLTEDDITRIKKHIAQGDQPWTGWWNKLCGDRQLDLNVKPNPQPAAYRADWTKHALIGDIYRAWCLALRWRLSSDNDTRYADKAVEFMDAWSGTLKMVGTVPEGSTAHDDHTFILMAGMQGHQWAQVGELMRGYSRWAPANFKRFQDMLTNVFASVSSWFLSEARLRSHANWDMASLCGAAAIGVFCDRPDLYRLACDYFAGKQSLDNPKMFGNGSIVHGVYFMHPGHLGQWEESGRDQGHSTLGMSLGGDLLEMAWNQGDDLYGLYNNRFLSAAEYVARSNLLDENGKTYPMPYAREQDPSQPHTALWTQVNQAFGGGPGSNRNCWEPIFNHYVNRMGLAAPNVARMVAQCEQNYWAGGDDMVFPTLTHRRSPYAGPMKAPSGVTAHLNDGRAVLSWWGSVGATSYVVSRGAKADGPFTRLATVTATQFLTHTDKPPVGTWFYQVTALGSGAATASAKPVRLAVPGEARVSLPLNGRNNTGTAGMQLVDGKWALFNSKLLDGATWGDGRLNDKAIAFDGKTARLQLPAGLFADLEDFTVSMWAYANGLHWDTCMFFSGRDGYSFMCIAPQSGAKGVLRFMIAGAGGNDGQVIEAPSALPTRRWVHVAVTLQGTTGRLYVDGKEVARTSDILLSPRQVGDQVSYLGRNWGHPSFDGRIQGFRVDAGALSAAEIAALAK